MTIERWSTPHSTNIASVEYDPDTQEMTVHFKSGRRSYVLSGVSATAAQDLANDPSPGSHYARHFRNNYKVRKL